MTQHRIGVARYNMVCLDTDRHQPCYLQRVPGWTWPQQWYETPTFNPFGLPPESLISVYRQFSLNHLKSYSSSSSCFSWYSFSSGGNITIHNSGSLPTKGGLRTPSRDTTFCVWLLRLVSRCYVLKTEWTSFFFGQWAGPLWVPLKEAASPAGWNLLASPLN